MKIRYCLWLTAACVAAGLNSCDDKEEIPSLSVSPLTLEMAPAGAVTKDLAIKATATRWTVASDAAWLHFDPASGSGDVAVRVTADLNTGAGARTATITVSGDNVEPITVSVSQGKPYVKSDFFGTYRAEYDKWDLDAKSAFYPVLEDGSYDYDNVITAREFCEAYAEDYNAAENPETPVTAEDCSYNYYDASRYTYFELTEDSFKMVRFVEVADGSGMSLYDIEGDYTYDPVQNVFIIHDVAVQDDPRDISVSMAGFEPGRTLALTVPDYYWWGAVSYDGQTDYLPWVAATYHTVPMQ